MMSNFTLCLISLGIVGGIPTCLCETILANEGSSARLTCINQQFQGKVVTARWGKDGGIFIAQKFESGVEHYVTEDKYSIDDDMMYLNIHNIETSDEGKYICKAEIDSEKPEKDDTILHHTIELLVSTRMQKQTGGSLPGYAVFILVIVVVLVINVVVVLAEIAIRRRKKSRSNQRSPQSDQIYKPVSSGNQKDGRKLRNKGEWKGRTV
ncbi:uncharacterized protein [Ptychodera flava]|uniref:uncharacterized protein n=1 Tax=Ptychodera flava TaxID=63121 RepID=UPI00396A1174